MLINYKKKIAFTLAEMMIVLAVIGVLSAILLPVATQSAPDEDVMKFKKGNNTFLNAIQVLVNSDKYYSEGNLTRTNTGMSVRFPGATYLCITFSDVIDTKSVNCNNVYNGDLALSIEPEAGFSPVNQADNLCAKHAVASQEQIVTMDGIVFYDPSPSFHFDSFIASKNAFGSENGIPYHPDSNGFDNTYKLFCMDIDGISNGEPPFGYGIRADGKVVMGDRAIEWAKKSVQRGNE